MNRAIKIIDVIMFLVSCIASIIWIVLLIGLYYHLKPTESLIRLSFLSSALLMVSLAFRRGEDVFK